MDVPQAQRVRNHGNGAEGHGGARQNRAEQKAEKRIEHARRDGNSQRVVERRQKTDFAGCCAWWRGSSCAPGRCRGVAAAAA